MPEPIAKFYQVNLRTLVQHSESIPAATPLREVQKRFTLHPHTYMAVLEGDRVLGICSREQVGMLLGTQFGFSLYGKQAVRERLAPNPMIISETQPVEEVLRQVFSRKEEDFYGDVVLVDAAGKFVGLMLVVALVRVQTQFLIDSIAQLEWQESRLRLQNDQMLNELRLAREVQVALLPQGPREILPNEKGDGQMLQWAHRYLPAGLVSGDFFHVRSITPQVAGAMMCDVMGHGVRAALITAMIRAFLQEMHGLAAEPHLLLGRLNDELTRMLAGLNEVIFATACYVVADTEARRWRWSCAGHPAPLLLQRATGLVQPLDQQREAGPVLGLLADAAFVSSECPMQAGDCVLLYTDGITEARKADGEEFGVERLSALLSSQAGAPVEKMLDEVLRSVEEFTGGAEAADDVCLLLTEATGF